MRRAALIGFVLVQGCVSEPSNAPKEGKLDGPCHDNGTCDDNLMCVPGIKRCAPQADASVTDSGMPDSSKDAGADAPNNTDACAPPNPMGGPQCLLTTSVCQSSQVCCVKGNAGTCAPPMDDCMAGGPYDFKWRCDRTSHCSAMNGFCCADNVMIMNTQACPLVVTSVMGNLTHCTMMGQACPSGPANGMLCGSDSDCTDPNFGSHCVAATFAGGGTTKVVGLCRP